MSSRASATSGLNATNKRLSRLPEMAKASKWPKSRLLGATKLSLIGLVAVSCALSQLTSQSSCQMTPTQATSAAYVRDPNHRPHDRLGDASNDDSPCNRQHGQQLTTTTNRQGQQRAMKQFDSQHYNPNQYSAAGLRHLQQQFATATRQQRQFGQMLARSANMLEAPQVHSGTHEEFSLSSSSTTSTNLSPEQSGNQQASEVGNSSASNETIVQRAARGQAETVPTATTANVASSTPQPTLANVSTTEQALPLSTTPMLATETIGSPVAPQPIATSTSSSVPMANAASTAAPNSANSQPQRQQQGRRIEESSTLVVDRHSSSLGEDQTGPKSNAISSLPSSTSIITPLINPAAGQQQQQQSSSMVKPIYVVGNPIGDLDYSSSMYGEHQAANRQKTDALPPAKPTGSTAFPQRAEKKLDSPLSSTQTSSTQAASSSEQQATPSAVFNGAANYGNDHQDQRPSAGGEGERMNGPALVYSGGHLVAGSSEQQQQQQAVLMLNATGSNSQSDAGENQLPTIGNSQQQPLPPLSPRLFQGPNGSSGQELGSAAVQPGSQRRPSLPPPVNQANAASGLRSPLSPSGPLIGQPVGGPPPVASNSLQQPANTNPQQQMANFYQTLPPYAGGAGSSHLFANGQMGGSMVQPSLLSNKQAFVLASQQQQQQHSHQMAPTAGAIPSQSQLPTTALQHQQQPQASITNQQQALGPSRRPLNITRVEHISAECSNDLIRAVIVFNGTFKGMIYSSGYVNDPTCLYVNGTGLTRYEFSIRLNQCGTLGRQELHQPTIPGEARRRDQVMWNTLSIQYNPVIEQEWDEHFRVSCEYGSDFWKTISFNPFNVETSTGSPVVFTINPPQCQMDVLLGHGMGPKIVDGPVTVGDPLTLLIHMKSEKAGYDILVKNCVAHNGGKQRMQLIDSNGCVVNERFISPFRGTYNDNDLRHVTLYAYLKAFRFTGSPVLYLECEIHMCQSACPPQMCYWRRLSKRSVDNNDFEYTDERAPLGNLTQEREPTKPVISEGLSLFKALQVRHEPVEPAKARLRAQQLQEIYAEDDEAQLVCYRHAEVLVFMATTGALLLLVLSVAVACCLRIRKMTKLSGQFKHSRLGGGAQSMSPSSFSTLSTSSSASLGSDCQSTRSPINFSTAARNNSHNQTSVLQQVLGAPLAFVGPSTNGNKQHQLLVNGSCPRRATDSELGCTVQTVANSIYTLNR